MSFYRLIFVNEVTSCEAAAIHYYEMLDPRFDPYGKAILPGRKNKYNYTSENIFSQCAHSCCRNLTQKRGKKKGKIVKQKLLQLCFS